MNCSVRFVLVNTSHPGNIGAVARAMKNMSLSELYLVEPKCFPHADATARASGADDLLESATLCETLDEALKGCELVFGSSARARRLSWPTLTPRESIETIAKASPGAAVAIVFGRENSGLTNDEIARCNYLVSIPSNPDYTSLNIAAAAQIFAYELQLQIIKNKVSKYEQADKDLNEIRVVTNDELAGLIGHFKRVMEETGFIEPGNPKTVIRRLRRLFARSKLDVDELNILRGLLSMVQNKLKVS
ncbi:tRNA (cytidine(32)/uridine(32)-2'-O)-methyltransferase [hydrothermal vent metagenome]|uniref:tRNA (Cytidine(32)/uridine(32)-2'-O)-methyltransferase n=1 Tax=hydrothermal vent metagenome TaxID=652676 RepID=A0A3B0ZNH2_9ZZZZ